MNSVRNANKAVFIAAFLGMFLFGVTLITLGSVAPEIQARYKLDGLASGTLFSILPFGIVFGSLVFGPVADRFGYKSILIISCLMIFAGLEGIVLSPSLTILKVCVFFFGFGGGAINGATNALVSDTSEGNSKSANLSLLGVFFAAGALGVPLLLGMLDTLASTATIINWLAYFTLVFAAFFVLVRFPKAKLSEGIAMNKLGGLLRDKLVLFVALFLVCQSGFEGIVNNWTVLYLTTNSAIEMRWALFALSLYVSGMAVARLALGYFLRLTDEKVVMVISMAALMTGNFLFVFASSYAVAVTSLVLTGAGLAAGFPVMLGIIGNRYAAISGTAFGLIISIALLGNMIVNYSAGLIVENYGVKHVTTLPFLLNVLMFVLIFLIDKLKSIKQK